ncbi:hypothetical protein H5410_002050, partial [Solanum commersonii]
VLSAFHVTLPFIPLLATIGFYKALNSSFHGVSPENSECGTSSKLQLSELAVKNYHLKDVALDYFDSARTKGLFFWIKYTKSVPYKRICSPKVERSWEDDKSVVMDHGTLVTPPVKFASPKPGPRRREDQHGDREGIRLGNFKLSKFADQELSASRCCVGVTVGPALFLFSLKHL